MEYVNAHKILVMVSLEPRERVNVITYVIARDRWPERQRHPGRCTRHVEAQVLNEISVEIIMHNVEQTSHIRVFV